MNAPNDAIPAVGSTPLFGVDVPLTGTLPTQEGYYIGLHKPSGFREPLKVRYSHHRNLLVVDVAGQDVDSSEELWRYKGDWLWSDRIECKSNVEKGDI